MFPIRVLCAVRPTLRTAATACRSNALPRSRHFSRSNIRRYAEPVTDASRPPANEQEEDEQEEDEEDEDEDEDEEDAEKDPEAVSDMQLFENYAQFLTEFAHQFKHVTPRQNWLGQETPFPKNPSFLPPPPLSNARRNELYELFVDDPHTNDIRALSNKFNISMKRVEAIIRLKDMEVEWIKKGQRLQTGFLAGMETVLNVEQRHRHAEEHNHDVAGPRLKMFEKEEGEVAYEAEETAYEDEETAYDEDGSELSEVEVKPPQEEVAPSQPVEVSAQAEVEAAEAESTMPDEVEPTEPLEDKSTEPLEDEPPKPVGIASALIPRRQNVHEADELEREESRDAVRQPYVRAYWESVDEYKGDPIVPSVLEHAVLHAKAAEAQENKRNRKFLYRVHDPRFNPNYEENPVHTPEKGTSIRFVDVGAKFLNVEEEQKRLAVAKRRTRYKEKKQMKANQSYEDYIDRLDNEDMAREAEEAAAWKAKQEAQSSGHS